jgi:hypothetical protein
VVFRSVKGQAQPHHRKPADTGTVSDESEDDETPDRYSRRAVELANPKIAYAARLPDRRRTS